MRKLFALMMSCIIVFSVGCSSNAGGDQVAPNGTANEPASGGIVRTTMPSEPDNLDPYLSAASDTDAVMNNVFEGLMRFDENGEILPQLATSYTISDDSLTYTFDIRTDVTFHNGDPMTIEDVLYSYKTLAGLNGMEILSSKFKLVKAIEKVDEDTLTFTLSEPSSAFLST